MADLYRALQVEYSLSRLKIHNIRQGIRTAIKALWFDKVYWTLGHLFLPKLTAGTPFLSKISKIYLYLWFNFWIRRNEFHRSLNLDTDMLLLDDHPVRHIKENYLWDLEVRRRNAHEMDLQTMDRRSKTLKTSAI